MADWSTILTSALGGGGVWGAVTFAQFLRDELRHKDQERHDVAAEARQEAEHPLVVQAQQLGLVDRATVIQQRAIDALEGQVEDLKLRYQILKQDSDQEIAGLKAENKMLREQVGGLYRTMGEMEAELRQHRGRGAQGA